MFETEDGCLREGKCWRLLDKVLCVHGAGKREGGGGGGQNWSGSAGATTALGRVGQSQCFACAGSVARGEVKQKAAPQHKAWRMGAWKGGFYSTRAQVHVGHSFVGIVAGGGGAAARGRAAAGAMLARRAAWVAWGG